MKKVLVILVMACAGGVAGLLTEIQTAHAAVPYITKEASTFVTEPELSKSYYGTLGDQSHEYIIASPRNFELLVSIAVPEEVQGALDTNRFEVEIMDMSTGRLIGGISAQEELAPFFDSFMREMYLISMPFRKKVVLGTYKVTVSGGSGLEEEDEPQGAHYVLTIGTQDKMSAADIIQMYMTIPVIKNTFFMKNPIEFLFTYAGILYVAGLVLLSWIFIHIMRKVLAHYKGNKCAIRNVTRHGSRWRFVLATTVLIITLLTTWHPFPILLAGFVYYEVVFRWCVMRGVRGK